MPAPVATTGGGTLSGYTLPGNRAISQLLNSVHAGAGVMSVAVTNTTSDAVWITFSPTSGTETYTEQWSFFRTPLAGTIITNDTSCGFRNIPSTAPPPGICAGTLSGAITTEQQATATPFTYEPRMSVRVFNPNSSERFPSCVGCSVTQSGNNVYPPSPATSTFEFQLDGGATPQTYTVVVGIKDLYNPRYATTNSGYAEAIGDVWTNSTGGGTTAFAYTGLPTPAALAPSGNNSNITCIDWEWIPAPTGTFPNREEAVCHARQTFGGVRYLSSVGVSLPQMEMRGTSAASAAMIYSKPDVIVTPSIGTNWQTLETAPL